VLDHHDRARASRELRELGTMLGEIIELSLNADLGWHALGVDPRRLPTFGGERPDVPGSFFWRWGCLTTGHATLLPAQVLSWDVDQLLLAADPHARPFSIPRHPASLFASPLSLRSGLTPCTDTEAFERLATVLPWDGSYETLGTALIALSAHDPSGRRCSSDDSRDLVVVVRNVGLSRGVVAVARTEALRDPDVAASLRKLDGEAPGTES
jgi:hypothetical protein